MIEISIEFQLGNISAVCRKLLELPEGLRPAEIAIDEVSERSPVSQSELGERDWLMQRYPNGSILYSAEGEYHLSYPETGASSLFGLINNDGAARRVFSGMADLDIEYGYACVPEERTHRNQVSAAKRYGTHEAWVGRDYSRYLPGAYWLNILPTSLLESLGLDIQDFDGIARSVELVDRRNYLVELYEASDRWVENVEAVDRWCVKTEGVFDRREAAAALDGAEKFLEASEALNRWR